MKEHIKCFLRGVLGALCGMWVSGFLVLLCYAATCLFTEASWHVGLRLWSVGILLGVSAVIGFYIGVWKSMQAK